MLTRCIVLLGWMDYPEGLAAVALESFEPAEPDQAIERRGHFGDSRARVPDPPSSNPLRRLACKRIGFQMARDPRHEIGYALG